MLFCTQHWKITPALIISQFNSFIIHRRFYSIDISHFTLIFNLLDYYRATKLKGLGEQIIIVTGTTCKLKKMQAINQYNTCITIVDHSDTRLWEVMVDPWHCLVFPQLKQQFNNKLEKHKKRSKFMFEHKRSVKANYICKLHG